MGQTLTNGIYLPAEGERNCYDGLEGNWRALDSLISTADGKASATHTHGNISNDGKVGTTANLPLITGTGGVVRAGSFGTSANTFCEGNDSRLSDARTPVAHTHTKSDVTDLLNSNFIPSANNSYDLGSSSYQWNNLHAKNYYYNGTAWGLDKANTWTGTNTFQQNITYERTNFLQQAANPCYLLKDTELEQGSLAPTAHAAYPGLWWDKNGAVLGYMRFVEYDTGKQTAEFRLSNLIKNGALDPTGSPISCTVHLELQPSGEKSLIPQLNNDINLGTSTNKWKTLNGVNPGALSLPDYNNVLDVTSEIPIASLDGNTQININDYLPNKTGWLNIVIDDTTGNSIIATQGRPGGATVYNNSRTFHIGAQNNGFISVFFPILADMNKFVSIKASSLIQMRFYYCLGNV